MSLYLKSDVTAGIVLKDMKKPLLLLFLLDRGVSSRHH